TQNNQNAIPEGGNAEDYTVEYYLSEEDAQNEENIIENPGSFENEENPETIYVRLTHEELGCFGVDSFELIVTPSGVANQPEDIMTCDVGEGDLIYDLTQVIDEVLDGQDPDEFDISFYETENQAANDNGAIEDPEDYLAQNENQTNWVRIQNAEHPECFNLTSFDLLTTTVTIGEDIENLEACDGGDGGLFNLTDAQSDILDGQSPLEYNTTYYENADDAEDGINPIENPEAYENQTNPQTIYVRIEANNAEDCYQTGSF